jgi:hypothetical protein
MTKRVTSAMIMEPWLSQQKAFPMKKREHPAFFYHQSTIVFCPPFAIVPSAFL